MDMRIFNLIFEWSPRFVRRKIYIVSIWFFVEFDTLSQDWLNVSDLFCMSIMTIFSDHNETILYEIHGDSLFI